MKYKIICDDHAQDIMDRVGISIEEGWEPLGGVSTFRWKDESNYGIETMGYAQSMILKDDLTIKTIIENNSKTVEVIRFKDTGKYYETVELQIPENVVLDDEIHSFVRRVKEEKEINEGWVWLITGKGTKFEVPRLIV